MPAPSFLKSPSSPVLLQPARYSSNFNITEERPVKYKAATGALNKSPSKEVLNKSFFARSRTGLAASSHDLHSREEEFARARQNRLDINHHSNPVDKYVKELNGLLSRAQAGNTRDNSFGQGGWLKLRDVARLDLNGRIGFVDFMHLCRRYVRCQWHEDKLFAIWEHVVQGCTPVDGKVAFFKLSSFLQAQPKFHKLEKQGKGVPQVDWKSTKLRQGTRSPHGHLSTFTREERVRMGDTNKATAQLSIHSNVDGLLKGLATPGAVPGGLGNGISRSTSPSKRAGGSHGGVHASEVGTEGQYESADQDDAMRMTGFGDDGGEATNAYLARPGL